MILETNLHLAADRLSNREFDDLTIMDEWLEEAGEALKEVLRKQLSPPPETSDVLRMSSVGKPLCQLQMQAAGAKAARKPYNFITQMMMGDIVEIIAILLLKISGANITGGNDKVSLKIVDAIINGTDDIELDGKVYDIKSCSPWAFNHKWSKGYEGLRESDDFGYIGQLVGYSKAKGKDPGGWIVVCKSTGRIKVVEFEGGDDEMSLVMQKIENTVSAILSKATFKRSFEPIDDKWRGKSTGLQRLCKTCEFCPYLGECWPSATFKAHPKSEAKDPPHYWFVEDE